MRLGTREVHLLDPPLFWRKLVLLLLFFPPFLLIWDYRKDLAFWYALFLVFLHAYVLLVFLYRVRWRVLAENRKGFYVRVAALILMLGILSMFNFALKYWEVALVLGVAFVVHVGILLSLTVVVRPVGSNEGPAAS